MPETILFSRKFYKIFCFSMNSAPALQVRKVISIVEHPEKLLHLEPWSKLQALI